MYVYRVSCGRAAAGMFAWRPSIRRTREGGRARHGSGIRSGQARVKSVQSSHYEPSSGRPVLVPSRGGLKAFEVSMTNVLTGVMAVLLAAVAIPANAQWLTHP